MERYPVIAFLLKNKQSLPPAATILVLVLGIFITIRVGTLDFVIVSAVLAPVIYVIVRSYLELIDVIAEMLLPHS